MIFWDAVDVDITELYALAKKFGKMLTPLIPVLKLGLRCFQSPQIYVGCNVENASYGLTICAERAAIYNAYQRESALLRQSSYVPMKQTVPPCGACLQVMAEFGDFDVFL